MGVLITLVLLLFQTTASMAEPFIFNGFKGANLTLDGIAVITSSGLLRLTNDSHFEAMGNAFFPLPICFKGSSSSATSNTVTSFSTSFVFAITGQISVRCHGLAFALSPNDGIVGGGVNNFLGLFNNSNLGNSSNHILAVEFDTCKDPMFKDINDNHVGIDINSLISVSAAPAAYLEQDNSNETITLQSGLPIFAWIDYESDRQLLNVSISPSTEPVKPSRPLLSQPVDLSSVLEDFMYVGFSSGIGILSGNHYILGWSFSTDGAAQSLDLSKLPSLPSPNDKARSRMYVIIVSVTAVVFMMVASAVYLYVAYKMQKKEELADIMEGWELDYPHRFSYRTLYKATDGFKEKGLLGKGGFGNVYKGVLPRTSSEVAVKRITHNGKQGLREFVAEVASLGRVTHRSLVRLQGWCKRQNELLLVYDFMPNGSLDDFLFDDTKASGLNWEQRMTILKGIADGLLYLHKGWEQVVVHRDVKSSNVLLDAEMNARLGDFGLARLHEHGQNPRTTGVMGTVGYLAPELYRTGKATVYADVFAYGALLLEVVCGKRPIHTWMEDNGGEEIVLAEWVLKWWQMGDITAAVDRRLEGRYVKEEAELVLKLGLLCSQAVPEARPTMRRVVQLLDGEDSIHQSMGLLDSVFCEDDKAEYNNGLPSFGSLSSDYDDSH